VSAPEAATGNRAVEALADYAHVAWSGWMSYLFSKTTPNPDGSVTIPAELVERWARQIETTYDDLSEPEKDSDRIEAKKIIEVIKRIRVGDPV
jgi:hypothetical protein